MRKVLLITNEWKINFRPEFMVNFKKYILKIIFLIYVDWGDETIRNVKAWHSEWVTTVVSAKHFDKWSENFHRTFPSPKWTSHDHIQKYKFLKIRNNQPTEIFLFYSLIYINVILYSKISYNDKVQIIWTIWCGSGIGISGTHRFVKFGTQVVTQK